LKYRARILKLKEYRKTISSYDCGDCKYHGQCRGGCQVRKYVEEGEIKGIDPLCPVKKDVEIIKEKEEKVKKLVKINVLHSI
jgi:MoaA/NifB/PqqE/SkfB family radical SAM enzyme